MYVFLTIDGNWCNSELGSLSKERLGCLNGEEVSEFKDEGVCSGEGLPARQKNSIQ